MRDLDVKLALEKLLKKVEVIDAKVSGMPRIQIQVSHRLLPTLLALYKLGPASASQVSRVTGRCRAFESKNLNELCMMGAVAKRGRGREKIFSVVQPVSSFNVHSVLNR